MFNMRFTHLIGLAGLALSGWLGFSLFNYFTHKETPHITLTGLTHGSSYKGTVEGSIDANTNYSIGRINAQLDHKPFEPLTKKLGFKKGSAPFTIDTTTLPEGHHTLELEVIDSSYHKNSSMQQIDFFVDNLPLQAVLLQTEFKVDQGNTIHVQVQCNKQVAKAEIKFINASYIGCPSHEESTLYDFYLPVDCEEESSEQMIKIDITDAVGNSEQLTAHATIHKVTFPKQRGFTVSAEKLEEEKEISLSSKILDEALAKWVKDSPHKKMWKGPFIMPVEGRIVTPYGEIRTTPERGRYLHKAIDVVTSPRNAVICASNSGTVIVKERYLISGNTIVLDHGMGIFTLYYHLDYPSDLEVGDVVQKGNKIGNVGKTGYATGYHLHWELTIKNRAVNPLEWIAKRMS